MIDTHPREAGLRYADDARPGLTRTRRGTGFSYRRADGEPASDETRARIEALAIPPAWDDVWICPDPRGHLQATGRDAKGRKQYRYHADWAAHRNRLKFDRMVSFGESLPTLRERVEADLKRPGLGRETVVALAVRLLDETMIRVGNTEYAQANGTYGLTTLRDKHVAFDGSGVRFSFVGKSGKEHAIDVADRRLARLVRACRDVPGYDLFQYQTGGGKATVGSGDVNDYLRETTGDDVTAKDFRTWGGTVLAAEYLATEAAEPDGDETDPDREVTACIVHVSDHLGNTPAVCRRYYVHPDILDAYHAGTLSGRLRRRHAGNTPAGLRPPEAAVLDILRDAVS